MLISFLILFVVIEITTKIVLHLIFAFGRSQIRFLDLIHDPS